MNSYSRVRVGIAGATGYAGVELLRRLAQHPHADVRLAMGSSTSEAKRVPALEKIWDAPVERFDVDRLAAETDAVFLAVPDTLAAEVGPALARRGPRVIRSLRRVPASERDRARSATIRIRRTRACR